MPVVIASTGKFALAVHRSQKTVTDPVVPGDRATDTLVTVKPYVGLDTTTNAAHRVADIVVSRVTDSGPVRLPPGALVVSTSTTVEPTTWGGDEGVGDGVADDVSVGDGDVEDVPVGDGDADNVDVGLGVFVAEKVAGGVPDKDAPKDGVCVTVSAEVVVGVTLGVGLGDACTTPWMYTPVA